MRISTSPEHGVKAGLTLTECLKTMKQAGFEGIDWSLCKDMDAPEKFLTIEWTREALETPRIAREEGLEIAQSHLPYYPGHIENPGDGSAEAFCEVWLPMYEHALEACALGKCDTAVIHPMFILDSYEKTVEGNVMIVEKLLPLLKQAGIRLALENVFARRNAQYVKAYVEEAATIKAIIDSVGSEYVGACLDTGHANIFRFDISECARTLGSSLFALHVNSNAGHDEHCIPYTVAGWCERMDFEKFYETLKEIGYTGWYNLEVTGGRFPKAAARPFYEYAAKVAKWLSGDDVK